MALTKCDECGKAGISSHAEQCPHCAAPAKVAFVTYRRKQSLEKEESETEKNRIKQQQKKRNSRRGKHVGAKHRPLNPNSWKSASKTTVSGKAMGFILIGSLFGILGNIVGGEGGAIIGIICAGICSFFYNFFDKKVYDELYRGSPFELAIRNQLEIPEDIISLEQIEAIVSLEAPNCGVSDISELIDLTNLKHLDLSGNKITSLRPIFELSNLTSLNLSNCHVADLSGFEKLTKLTDIFLSENEVISLKPLSHLQNLRYLQIKNNPHLTNAEVDSLKSNFPKCKIIATGNLLKNL